MFLTLPLPPTDNELHIVSRSTGCIINSPKYREWLLDAKKILFEANISVLVPEPTQVAQHEYYVTIRLSNYKSDFSNYSKALKDVLQGFLYKDDQWVNLSVYMPVYVDPTLKQGYAEIYTCPRIYSTIGVSQKA